MDSRTGFLFVLFLLYLTNPSASAEDRLGLYVGGSAGDAHLRSTENVSPAGPLVDNDYLFRFDQARLGWQVMAGIRPIPFAGIEVGYADFGRATAPLPASPFQFVGDSAQQSAATAFAVGYWPPPIPFLDIYAKVGAARLRTQGQATYRPPYLLCPVMISCDIAINQNHWDTDFAYGAGVQAKMGALAVLVEYERINASGGNPDLLSFGGLWRF